MCALVTGVQTCALPIWIGDGKDSGYLAAHAHEDRGGTICAKLVRLRGQGRGGDALFVQEAGIAQRNPLAFDRAQRALSGRRIEVADTGDIDAQGPWRLEENGSAQWRGRGGESGGSKG